MAANGATTGTPFSINTSSNCFFNFYDNGGPTGDYNNNANAYVTFAPSNPSTHKVRVLFTSFHLEAGWDALYIYNSNVTGSNQVIGPQGVTHSGLQAGNWQTISPGVVTANSGIAAVGSNPDEALTFLFRSDGSNKAPGWSARVTQVPKSACILTAPGPIAASTGPGSTNSFANVNSPLPVFSPSACNDSYALQYRINGGQPVPVNTVGFVTISAPKGDNVITWELVDQCGGAVMSAAAQSIAVVDNTPPQITCPNDVTINLDAGACTKQFSYNVTCTDNTGFPVTGSVEHPIDFDNGSAGIMFDIKNLGYTNLTITEFGPSIDAGNWPVQVYHTTSAVSWQGNENNAAAWTLAGALDVVSASPASGTPIPGFGITLAPGESRGIYITSTIGAPVNYTGDGVSVSRQFDDGRLLVSSNPGAGKTYPFGNTFQSRAYNGYVHYEALGSNGAVQTGGLPPGGEFPIGETINTYVCTDVDGNTAACSFKVTVAAYSNPILSLICNDLVFIALGPDCQTEIGADDVLEGGLYGCYDNYKVELDKIPPYGNGPWVPAFLSAADVGKSYSVRVTDPSTGNKCFGNIKVQDNLPPDLDCTPVTLPGNFPTSPEFIQATNVNVRFGAQGLPLNLVDFQTREFELPVSLPPGATVNDVDFRVKVSGDAFFGNLRMQVESPAGIIVNTWNQVSGCGPDPVWARFDDEGSNTVTCPMFTTDKKIQIPFGIGQLSTFDGQQVNGTWKLRISDVNGGNDLSKIEIAELLLNVNGNFTTGFPNGLTAPPLISNGSASFLVPAGLLDACSDVTLTYTDQTTPQNCASGLLSIISRRWMAKDASGNTATCIQPIYLLRPTLADVILPPNFDFVDEPGFSCTDTYPTPNWIEAQGFQGYPHVYDMPNGTASVSWQYTDNVIEICDGTYTIKRNWVIIDACTSEIINHMQVIQVRDDMAPNIACPANVTVTTDPFSCCGTVDLPDVIVSDGCSRINSVSAEITTVDPYTLNIINVVQIDGSVESFPGNNLDIADTLAVFGDGGCLPIGTHTVVYTATDACGNTGTCSFLLKVCDFSPPVAACDEFTVVAVGPDDPHDCYLPSANGCEFAGVTWVKAYTFDDGSYDNCNSIKFTIRRAPPYSACIKALNPDNGHPDCFDGDPDAISEYEVATMEGDSIKFYCCEVGTSQMVILRVYQLDPDGNISKYPDGTPIYNECQVEIEVQDKLKPICNPPLNVTVSCENFDPSLWAYGKPGVYDNCCLDSTKVYQGQKGLTHSANYSQFDTTCNKGTITRTFRAYDCKGANTQCTQRIIVNYEQDYYIKFPDDKIVTVCDGSGTYGEPTFYGKDCELMGITYQDQVYTVVPDACFKIERTWKIINWCTYLPQAPCVIVPNPNPNSNQTSSLNLPGPIVSPAGTPAPWAPTSVKILPTDQSPTNYSTFWKADANCYEYKQIIKVIDTNAPITVCPPSPVEYCDNSTNDPQLWNETYWWDAACETHDLCEGTADLNISATDLCSGANLTARYLLFLDLDNDGSMETVVSSTNVPDPGTVRFNNVNTQNFAGGTVRNFDERNVPTNQKYRFALETSVSGTNLTAFVRWNTIQSPTTFVKPELPYGTHKVKWIISDGCGNETVCEYNFVVKDCKAPTVVCINGLSVNIMQSGSVMIFTSDFLLHANDNCTPEDMLVFGMRRSNDGTTFPVDANGLPITKLTFTCGDDIGNQPVELWAMDKAGNADFCETTIAIQDNMDNCGNNNSTTTATVAGALKTESDEGLEDCDVEISGQDPTGPTFNYFAMTNDAGEFQFNDNVPMYSNYTLTPTKDDNPLNGVSTYDLVLISKHILGLQPFDTPYKTIAADANSSGSVTTFDVVELRKLILGMYSELPNSTSWRFVDKSFAFPSPANPFQTAFPETKAVSDLQSNQLTDDFVAIKVGDVNNTAMANSLMSTDDRSNGTLLFDVEDRMVKSGEEFAVSFKAAEKVTGYQFTLNYTDLEIADVMPGNDMKAENFALFPEANAITTSWNGAGQAEFAVKFRAKKAGKLSEMIGVSSRITMAEAYSFTEEKQEVAFRFNSQEGTTITGVGFELYQNQPNPFVNKTIIGFHLPEAERATLSIYDENGRLLHTQSGDFGQGYNSVSIDRNSLRTTGLLYYSLETAHETATRKMILLK
ncbi:MAG: HYR domain-containing protein [Lewinellaceae bacterium]|nr:HYR domain-containing protein [Lewinellaceae bacterium]